MLVENSERILEAIRSVNRASNATEVVSTLSGFIEHYGFSRIYLGQLVNPANVNVDNVLYISTWPDELRRHREEELSILHDPVARCALRSKRPFRWQEAYQSATSKGRRIVDLVHDYGINDGYMFPVHRIDSVSGGVSLGGEQLDLSSQAVSEVEIVATSAYSRLEGLLGPFPYQSVPDLTPRELDVLQYAAAGKTNWEIGEIIGIREDTVKKTLGRASIKLNAVNRAHAVAQAIAKNQIFA